MSEWGLRVLKFQPVAGRQEITSKMDKPRNSNIQIISKYGDEEAKETARSVGNSWLWELESGEGEWQRIGIFHYKPFSTL